MVLWLVLILLAISNCVVIPMEKMFEIFEIDKDTWQICESNFVNMYLLAGTEQALLIDTGNGSLRLPEIIGTLTDLPVTAAATHNHCDHVGGAGWFHEVLVHEADMNMSPRWSYSPKYSRRLAELMKGPYRFEPQPYPVRFAPVKSGHVFHLGGRDVKVIHSPGHTPGSILLQDESHNLLFTGDNAGPKGQMIIPGSCSISIWADSLKKCLDLIHEDTGVYWGHDEGRTSKEEIEAVYIAACELLDKTKRNGFPGWPASWPKGKGRGKFVYNTNNVF